MGLKHNDKDFDKHKIQSVLHSNKQAKNIHDVLKNITGKPDGTGKIEHEDVD
jgi:hypothetical protein